MGNVCVGSQKKILKADSNSKKEKTAKDLHTRPSMGTITENQSTIIKMDKEAADTQKQDSQTIPSSKPTLTTIKPPTLIRHLETFKTEDYCPTNPAVLTVGQ